MSTMGGEVFHLQRNEQTNCQPKDNPVAKRFQAKLCLKEFLCLFGKFCSIVPMACAFCCTEYRAYPTRRLPLAAH